MMMPANPVEFHLLDTELAGCVPGGFQSDTNPMTKYNMSTIYDCLYVGLISCLNIV